MNFILPFPPCKVEQKSKSNVQNNKCGHTYWRNQTHILKQMKKKCKYNTKTPSDFKYIHYFILHVLKPTSTKKADKNQSWLPILGAYSIWSMVSRISRVVIVSYSVLLVQANVLVGAYSFAVPAMQTMHFSSLFFKLFTNNVCLLSLILFWILYRDP